jgi:beta-phosphoglucomutase
MTVLFDFNGTLVFDTPLQVLAWDKTARELCGRGVSASEYAGRLSGLDNAATADYLAGRRVSREEAEECSRKKEAIYFRLAESRGLPLVPGAADYLERLRARGVKNTIASSAGEQNMDRYFAMLGLERWFSRETVVCRTPDLPGKPDPAVFLAAMRRLGAAPADTLIFEDSAAGLTAALRSGARAAAIVGTLDEETLRRIPGLAAVLKDYNEAAAWDGRM